MISEKAKRRMVKATQAALDRNLVGGELWFTPEGEGGAWYSGASLPPDPHRTVIVQLRPDATAEELVEAAVERWEEVYA